MVISNGAALKTLDYTQGMRVGEFDTSHGNRVWVTGSGSMITNKSTGLYEVGYWGTNNSVIIDNGGCVNVYEMQIGRNPGSDYNSVVVTGTDSTMLIRNELWLGRSGQNNSLLIANGGRCDIATNLIMAVNSSSSGMVTLDNGTLTVTNNSGVAMLSVGQLGFGTLMITNNGMVQVDRLLVGPKEGSVGNVEVYVDNTSSGIDLTSDDNNKFVIGDASTVKLYFNADPINLGEPLWGLRMAGDQAAYIATLHSEGRLLWYANGISAGGGANRLGITVMDGMTYVGVRPLRGTVILVR